MIREETFTLSEIIKIIDPSLTVMSNVDDEAIEVYKQPELCAIAAHNHKASQTELIRTLLYKAKVSQYNSALDDAIAAMSFRFKK